MARKTLTDILAEKDDLGLLANLRPAPSSPTPENQRARQKLEEINVFIDRHHRLPGEVGAGVKVAPSEKMLQYALAGLRSDPESANSLKAFDRHNLFEAPSAKAPSSIDEIILSDDALLHTDADLIFDLSGTSALRAKPDRKAERQQCKEFASFKPLFDACLAEIKTGRRKTREFRMEQEVLVGEFFILNGSLLYIAEVNEPHIRSGKANARLRVIFDNGTESDNLLRSLAAELYKDGPAGRGRRVTSPDAGPLFDDAAVGVPVTSAEDIRTGHVYVVRSLSVDPEIKRLDGYLYKIGFTTGNVEARILTAKDDPTFLLAPVQPVKSYAVYNLNTSKMESLLHRFFGDVRLDIEIKDRFNRSCRPREWFLVPIGIVDEAIKRLIDGSIVDYRYDKESGRIVRLNP